MKRRAYKNRIRSLTRWPADPRYRKELAEMDVEFCLTMGSIYFPHLVGAVPLPLVKIWSTAIEQLKSLEKWN